MIEARRTRRISKSALFLVPLFLCAAAVPVLCDESPQANDQARKLRISKIGSPLKLDEFLNGGRQDWLSIQDFRQYEPGDGTPSSENTEAYLAYDEINLYVGFICHAKEGNVRALMSKRENIDDDDRVSVYLDSFHDRRRAYVFSSNPFGIQKDSVLTEGQDEDTDFDTVWQTEGKIIAEGYAVLFIIPFKSLRFSNQAKQTWGVALSRYIVRNQETVFWPYVTRRIEGTIQQMGELEGLKDISPKQNVQVIPYGTFAEARFLEKHPTGFTKQGEMRGGVDAKVVMRSAFTLDATVNPDFSQIESDDPQVTVNRRYEVYFPEKRPFFLENAGFFKTPIELLYSRRIVDPEFGARLTGRTGSWSIAMLASDDRAPGSQLEVGDPLYNGRAGISVFRLQREFQNQSTIGGLVTSRGFGPESNRVYSLDSRIRINDNWIVTGQAATSHTHNSDGTSTTGNGYLAKISHGGTHFNYSGSYTDLSPGFHTDLGFVKRVDMREVKQKAGYLWRPEESRILSIGPSLSTSVNWDRMGRLQDWNTYADFSVYFRGPTGLTVTRSETYELYLNQGFRYSRTDCSFYIYNWQAISIYGDYGWGTGVNYEPASGLAPFIAKSTDGYFGFTLRPFPKLESKHIYYYSQLGIPTDSSVLAQFGSGRVLVNHLVRWKLNYQFTHRLSARLILDYSSTSPNTSLIEEVPYKQFKGDILLTYLVNPSTAFYVGYTDRYDNLEFLPSDPPALRYTSSPTLSTARQFFVKLSYLFRF
jgi:hypothetical protein